MKLKYIIPFIMLLLLSGLSTLAMTSNQVKQITFQKYVEPLFPYGLVFDGIVEGSVSIAVDINVDGTVEDWLPLSSSNEKLTNEIEKVIDQWIFNPLIKDGIPSPVVYEIQFQFSHRGVTFSGGNLTQLYLNQITSRMSDNRLVFNLSELDKIPTPVGLIHPRGVRGPEGENMEGRILVEFFIDEEGNVRLPVVREIDGPTELAHSAYRAISQWKFEPPVRNGKPVTVRVRQSVVFSEDN